MSALTKDQIAKAINEKVGFPLSKSLQLTETLIELIKKSLSTGEDVLISGFGKFSVKSKRARVGRNPATGQNIVLKPRKVVTFHSSSKLREKINHG